HARVEIARRLAERDWATNRTSVRPQEALAYWKQLSSRQRASTERRAPDADLEDLEERLLGRVQMRPMKRQRRKTLAFTLAAVPATEARSYVFPVAIRPPAASPICPAAPPAAIWTTTNWPSILDEDLLRGDLARLSRRAHSRTLRAGRQQTAQDRGPDQRR